MQAVIPINFGRPAVPLLESIRSPLLTMTLSLIPSNFMNSFVLLMHLELLWVASEIFTHGMPLSAMNSTMGRGDEPLRILQTSPSLTSFHSTLITQPHQILLNLHFQPRTFLKLLFQLRR